MYVHESKLSNTKVFFKTLELEPLSVVNGSVQLAKRCEPQIKNLKFFTATLLHTYLYFSFTQRPNLSAQRAHQQLSNHKTHKN